MYDKPKNAWAGVLPAGLSDKFIRAIGLWPGFGVMAGRLARRSMLLAGVATALLGMSALGALGARWGFAGLVVALALIAFRHSDDDADEGALPQVQAPLAATEERWQDGWRRIVDALPDPAVALDQLGNVAHANGAMSELFPATRLGTPFNHVSRHPELMDAIDRVGEVGPAGKPVTVEFTERLPVERRLWCTVSPLAGPRGQNGLPSLLVVFRDLTERDRLDQMRADFVANASHELRTPLTSLRGFVETLRGPARDDAKARDRFLGLMASQAERMTRLIDDLLSLSRVEMRAHLPPRGTVDLNDVAAHVEQTLDPLARELGIKVSTVPLPGGARVRGERDEIVQVVQNLMQNAIKYGRRDGHVLVTVERTVSPPGAAPRLNLTVADDGPGIAPEHLPRLTERFYRVDAARSREKGGTGLGLAIVKHIVMRHRGELRITSNLGEGSRFTVDFEELKDPTRSQ